MPRLLPVLLRRPANLIAVPEADRLPPARRAGFVHGDPAAWAPAACARLQPEPWTSACDLLLAPAPRMGAESEALLGILDELPPERWTILYERDWPLWPNVLLQDGGSDCGIHFGDPAAGLRAYRSAFRQGGRGFAEALQVLPARRAADLLRGSSRAARGARGGGLQNRRFLQTALDYRRSLALVLGGPAALGAARRVALIAPHFDDDAIQAGGAILAAIAAGAELRVIWMTDGSRGVPGVAAAEATRIRKAEARAAMESLGVHDLHFLDAPEERLAARGPWTARLRTLLEEFAPQRTHVVWWADNHVDHYECTRVLRAAWPAALAEARLAATGAWALLPGRARLAVEGEARRRKDAAIRAYASQIAAVDYLRAERGITRWYARDLPGTNSVECFWETTAAEYFAAFRASGADRRVWI